MYFRWVLVKLNFISDKSVLVSHDDVIKWKHFRRNWPCVWGIHRSPVNSPHKGQWRGALMFSFICAWISGCVNNREAGDLRRRRTHYDVTLMITDLVLNMLETCQCWKMRVVMMSTLSILVAPRVVVMTTCGATSDDEVGIMTNLCFQWLWYCILCWIIGSM